MLAFFRNFFLMLSKYFYYIFCKIFFKIYCPLTIIGRENLPSSPFIICSNHNSHLDTPVLMLATGLSFDSFGMIAAKDYFFDNKMRKWIVSAFMNLIPLDRKSTRKIITANLNYCKQFISQKQRNLIIYPEGTRSTTGEMQKFKRGSAMFALELGVMLIPVYIKGTYQALPKGCSIPKRANITVRIGSPIYLGDIAKENSLHQYLKITEQLENKIKSLRIE